MSNVRTAIYNKYNASTGHGAYTNVAGRFYHGQAPQGATFPYVVFFNIVDVNEVDFSEEREDLSYQFSIFSQNSSPTQAETILTGLRSLFDDCSLTVTNWRHLYMQRGNTYPNNDYAQVPPIHGFSIEYDILIEKAK